MAKTKKKDEPSAEELARREAYWKERNAEAREYWRVGMVTSLPVFSDLEGGITDDAGEFVQAGAYTQMLPGVVEGINGDTASVRIYAAPEYGYRLEGYNLHKQRAINVPLVELGVYHGNDDLEAIVRDGLLEHGSPEIAEKVRQRERECDARVKAMSGRRKKDDSDSLDLFGDAPE